MSVSKTQAAEWLENPVTAHYFSELRKQKLEAQQKERYVPTDSNGNAVNSDSVGMFNSFVAGQIEGIDVAIDLRKELVEDKNNDD